jgi:hypothetical protein
LAAFVIKKLAKVNKNPMGENGEFSPNLVTLTWKGCSTYIV